jgi:hypothetical protein
MIQINGVEITEVTKELIDSLSVADMNIVCQLYEEYVRGTLSYEDYRNEIFSWVEEGDLLPQDWTEENVRVFSQEPLFEDMAIEVGEYFIDQKNFSPDWDEEKWRCSYVFDEHREEIEASIREFSAKLKKETQKSMEGDMER